MLARMEQVPAAPLSFHPERILILPRAAADRELQRLHAEHGCRASQCSSTVQLVTLAQGDSVEEAVARYQSSGLVHFAEPDYVVSAAGTFPNDPRLADGTQWWLNNFGQDGGTAGADIDAKLAWDVVRTASNVVIAIVDSRVRHTHADLLENIWRNPADGTPGFNALTGGHDPWDNYGHGTHLAGIIGGVADNAEGISGVAWRTSIMACKFLNAFGNGFNSHAVACIEFARTNGARVINLSWGGSTFSAAVSNAIWLARLDGIVVAAAAGNNATNVDNAPFYPACIRLDNIVSVAASTRFDTPWNFSNHGPTNVHLFAPGSEMFSTGINSDTDYSTREGTSAASAVVVGALALMSPSASGLNPQQLINRLLSATDTINTFTNLCVSGGRLNLRRALDHPALSIVSHSLPLTLHVAGPPGHVYCMATSSNLLDWLPLQTNTVGSDGAWTFADPASSPAPARYYRVEPGR